MIVTRQKIMSSTFPEGLPPNHLPSEVLKQSGTSAHNEIPQHSHELKKTSELRPWIGIRSLTNKLSPKLANPGYVARSRFIYSRLKNELSSNYSGWYLAIEPDSGDYFLNASKAIAQQQARHQHPLRLICTFQLDATGA